MIPGSPSRNLAEANANSLWRSINNPLLEFLKYISSHSEITKYKKTSHRERESAESPGKILDNKFIRCSIQSKYVFYV